MTKDVRQSIREYIEKHVSTTFEDGTDIFSTGVVNSLFSIQLMTYIERTFDVKFTMDDMSWENLGSVAALGEFVEAKTKVGER